MVELGFDNLLKDIFFGTLISDLQIVVEPWNLVPRNYSAWEKVLGQISRTKAYAKKKGKLS